MDRVDFAGSSGGLGLLSLFPRIRLPSIMLKSFLPSQVGFDLLRQDCVNQARAISRTVGNGPSLLHIVGSTRVLMGLMRPIDPSLSHNFELVITQFYPPLKLGWA